MAPPDVKVKKVKAFPIAGQLKTQSASPVAMPMQIVKLTQIGFLAEITVSSLQPGEKFDCTFELPVLHRSINEPVVMIKLYNQWGGNTAPLVQPAQPQPQPVAPATAPGGPAVLRLIEVHFVALSDAGRTSIVTFLNSMQKSKSS